MRKLFKKRKQLVCAEDRVNSGHLTPRAHVLNPFTPLEEEIWATCLHRHQKPTWYSGGKKFKIQSQVKIPSFRSLASDRMDMQFSRSGINSMLFLPLTSTCYKGMTPICTNELHHIGGRAVIPLHSAEVTSFRV